jgi:type I restriction enzyme, S subunit
MTPDAAQFVGRPRYRSYPAYKDSGVEWLGRIPAHWDAVRLKRVFRILNGSTPQSDVPEYWDGDIPWVTPDDIGNLSFPEITGTRRRITDKGYQSCGTTLAPTGSLVLSTRAPIGHLAIAAMPLCTNQGCRSLVPRMSRPTRYFYFQLKAAKAVLQAAGQGSTFTELSSEDLARVVIADPPLDEQQRIATFLDRETARIDALVAQKQQLIELLQEKRTALITRAVTKGLDPQAPTKHSGVEWLESVPAHWGATHLKYAASRIVDCPHETPVYSALGEHFVIRTADVSEGRLDLSDARRVEDDEFRNRIRRLVVVADDVVYSREGERFGFAALVPKSVSVCLGQRMMQFRVGSRWDPRFLMWQLNGKSVHDQASLDTTGATSPHVNVETIRNFWLAEPPIAEQRMIATFIERETHRIDDLMGKIDLAIDKLDELRGALISATVTGQLDIREHVA